MIYDKIKDFIDSEVGPLEARALDAEAERDALAYEIDELRAQLKSVYATIGAMIAPTSVAANVTSVAEEPVSTVAEPVAETVTPTVVEAVVETAPVVEPVKESADNSGDFDAFRSALEKTLGHKIDASFKPVDVQTVSEPVVETVADDDKDELVNDYRSVRINALDWVDSLRDKRLISYDDQNILYAMNEFIDEPVGGRLLFETAETFGFSLSRSAFYRNARILAERFPEWIELKEGPPREWLLRSTPLTPDPDDDPDGGKPVSAEPVVEATDTKTVDMSARKRCPTDKRTVKSVYQAKSGETSSYFKLPSMRWHWSSDGHGNRVARSHPFFDWWHATASGDWCLARDLNGSYALWVSTHEDTKVLLASGLVAEEGEAFKFSLSYKLDLSSFDYEEADKRHAAETRAHKAQRSSKKCPKFARTVFRDNKLERDLEASPEWHGFTLPAMKRLATWGNKKVTRPHPIEEGEVIETRDYPTVLETNSKLDDLWGIAVEDWIITAPELERSAGYGPTTIENATMWARVEDFALLRVAV